MLLALVIVVLSLIAVVFSADSLLDNCVELAEKMKVTPMLIGILVVGFGTSSPEITVAIISSVNDSPNLALGNAFGSNIANIGLVLGLTALLAPITVHFDAIRKELPVLLLVTLISVLLMIDLDISGLDAAIMLMLFASALGYSIYTGVTTASSNSTVSLGDSQSTSDNSSYDVELENTNNSINDRPEQSDKHTLSTAWLVLMSILSLIVLIVSSRFLVWGSLEIAQSLGVSELVIGLTVVAIGTSIPELAAAIASIRKKEHDLILGTIVGSNLFNTLLVVGVAGIIKPIEIDPPLLYRDVTVMCLVTIMLLLFGYRFGKECRINRLEGGLLLGVFVLYLSYLGYFTLVS